MKTELKIDQLDRVNGGGLFSRFRDKQYAAAGITVKGAGWFYNDGYEYNGKEISTDEANWLAYYYYWNKKRAPSMAEAKRYYEANSYEYDYCDH